MNLIPCAFCKGKDRDPFNLLSELATCQVCAGTGKVKITEPAINWAYCKGTGTYPHSVHITCNVCKGKGLVTVKGVTEECPKHKGTAEAIDSGLPCIKCGGRGVVRKGG